VSELTLMILRIGFLLLLWLFILSVLYALRSDLFGAPVRKMPSDAAKAPSNQQDNSTAPTPPISPAGPSLPSAGSSAEPRTLVITSGVAAGTTLPLDDDTITIGRSPDSTLAIVDEYTSTYHAKLARSGTQWLLTDLDSTNGTKLNGSRVNGTALVPVFTPITIGTTTFELRP